MIIKAESGFLRKKGHCQLVIEGKNYNFEVNNTLLIDNCEKQKIDCLKINNSEFEVLTLKCDCYVKIIDTKVKKLIIDGKCELKFDNSIIEEICIVKSEKYEAIDAVVYTKPAGRYLTRELIYYSPKKKNKIFEVPANVVSSQEITNDYLEHLIVIGEKTFVTLNSCLNIKTIWLPKHFNYDTDDGYGSQYIEFGASTNHPESIDIFLEGKKSDLEDVVLKGLRRTETEPPYVIINWHVNTSLDEYKNFLKENFKED